MEHVLVVIDMQKVFERGQWHVTNMPEVTENVVRLCRVFGGRTIFTKHMSDPAAKGTWREYNKAFADMEEDPSNWELTDKIRPFANAGNTAVKHTYSCFKSEEFNKLYKNPEDTVMVIAGVETDYCVISSLFDAVDAGYRVILVKDAVGTEKDSLNRAVIEICERMPSQVKLKTTGEIIKESVSK